MYSAAKIAYYNAARQAMPALLQTARNGKDDSAYGEERVKIFTDSVRIYEADQGYFRSKRRLLFTPLLFDASKRLWLDARGFDMRYSHPGVHCRDDH